MKLVLFSLLSVIFTSGYSQNENNENLSGVLKSYKIIIEKNTWAGTGTGANWNLIVKSHSNGNIYKNEIKKVFPELEGKILVDGKKVVDFYVVIKQYSPELHTVDYVEVDQYSITSRYAFNITYAQKIEVSIYDKEGKLIKNKVINEGKDEYEESFSRVLYNPTYLNDARDTPQLHSQKIREQPEKYLKLNEKIKEALVTYTGESEVSAK